MCWSSSVWRIRDNIVLLWKLLKVVTPRDTAGCRLSFLIDCRARGRAGLI